MRSGDSKSRRRNPSNARSSARDSVRDSVRSNDAELVRRVVESDDRQAFAHLVERHQSGLRRSLRRFVRQDHALADDLAQECFLLAYRQLETFRGDSSFRTWLFRIGYRLFLSLVRSRAPTTEALEDTADIADDRHDPGSLTNTFIRDFNRALTELAPEQARAVVLSLEHGFTHAEIAMIMSLPLGTAKSHVLRGRARLQAQLADWQHNSTKIG